MKILRSRRALAVALPVVLFGVVVSGCSGYSANTSTTEPPTTTSTTDFIAEALAFPVDDYTVKIKKVGTAEGTVNVTYHHYQHLTYEAEPVDADYQSLYIAVPVKIDGTEVDASDVPILLDITVGDYLASPNRRPVRPVTTTLDTTASSTTTTDAIAEETTSEAGAEESTTTTTIVAAAPGSKGTTTANADQALAAGYVVVSPGCRGSDNISREGNYFGKAPAAIVDLKCAVKYLRFNDSLIPGDSDRIISTGTSAGGGLSALLGTSGDSELYQPYFNQLGAAEASDAIFASAVYCPITDLAHADGAYEWQFGTTPMGISLVDQALSAQLASGFAAYLTSLELVGRSGFGTITADNYTDYLVQTFVLPSLKEYLASLSEVETAAYVASNPWIGWDGNSVTFEWADYVSYVGRSKSLPAYDAFDLSTPECRLFGDVDTDARHFTEFSLRQTGQVDTPVVDPDLEPPTLDPGLQETIDLMNPMYFTGENSAGCVRYWWIRQGATDSEAPLPVFVNMVTSLENLGKEVNATLYWEAGHCTNEDAADFVAWIELITTSGV